MNILGGDTMFILMMGAVHSRGAAHHRPDLRTALPSRIEGTVVRAHWFGWAEGRQGRRRDRAADIPRSHSGEYEYVEARGHAQQGGEPHHQGPYARRHRRGFLRSRDPKPGRASRTLPRHSVNARSHPDALKELVEDKFVDALRSTAATMTMQQLQDQRPEFVQGVQNAVSEDLDEERPRAGKRLANEPRPDHAKNSSTRTMPSMPKA